jgi:predicted transposase/invertase (TIGR01784 family)
MVNYSLRPLISFDWAIKRLLRQKANFGILEGFLTELLEQEITVKSIPESETNKQNEDDKTSRVDILCENSKGELMLIELQYYAELDFLHRMLFGASKLITDYLKEGEPYGNVKKVYSINIVYFDLGQGDDYVYYGKTDFTGIHQKDNLQLSTTQKTKWQKEFPKQLYPEYYIIKVNNFDNVAKDTLDEWIYYFKNNALPEKYRGKGLDKVEAQLKIDAMNTQERKEYEEHVKNLAVSQSMLETAKWEGIMEGKLQGKLEGKLEGMSEANRNFTVSLINSTDFSDEKIASLVGVDAGWVKETRKQITK